MPYFEVHLASGRIIQGSIPFNAGTIDEPIDKIVIEHPQQKITLEGYAHYFIYNEALVLMGTAQKRYAVNVGCVQGNQMNGYVFTETFCGPKHFNLEEFHPDTLKNIFKNGKICLKIDNEESALYIDHAHDTSDESAGGADNLPPSAETLETKEQPVVQAI